ncbi:glutathione S-transferase theta-1-like [Hemicordylus capensis]|uniref:glutathione S-transferase theta-1-like n=1 Tax=Hemicordylus capensis TaxID=884348 RepID=UPI00230447EB|nr:glutathione S-transferase theta-1-like [Hemicordylus capensis]
MGLELYLDLLSQPCRSVYLFAQKNGIPFEFKHVDLTKGQHREEAFAKVSMLQKVPVLKDGDFTLAESIAILLYLARKFKTPDHWYPSDLQKRARVDEYLSWQHTGTRMSGSKVFLLKGLVPLFLDKPLPPEKLQEAIEELNGTLKTFEEKFLQDRPFIVGDEISLADLVAIVELMQPVAVGHDIFDGRPKMSAWRHRVEDAIGKDLFLESHKLLFGYKDKTAEQIPPDMKEKLLPIVLKYVK